MYDYHTLLFTTAPLHIVIEDLILTKTKSNDIVHYSNTNILY